MFVEEYLKTYHEDIIKLGFQQKVMAGVFFLHKQIYGMEQFDKIYDEHLLSFYNDIINELTYRSDTETSRMALRNRLKDSKIKIPDTDEFSSKEGVFAQYAMISASYLISFSIECKQADLYKSLEASIENLCMQNQLSDTPQSDDVFHWFIFSEWSELIRIMQF